MPYAGLALHAFQTADIRAGLSQRQAEAPVCLAPLVLSWTCNESPWCACSHTYARAVYELDELFGDWQSLSKPVQGAVLAELQYAITSSTRLVLRSGAALGVAAD